MKQQHRHHRISSNFDPRAWLQNNPLGHHWEIPGYGASSQNAMPGKWSGRTSNWLQMNGLSLRQDCRKITDHFRGIYRIYPYLMKENRRTSTFKRLNLQTLGSQPTMPKTGLKADFKSIKLRKVTLFRVWGLRWPCLCATCRLTKVWPTIGFTDGCSVSRSHFRPPK